MKGCTIILLCAVLTATASAAPSGHVAKRSTAVEQAYQNIIANLLDLVAVQEAEVEDAGLLDDLELADEEGYDLNGVEVEGYNLDNVDVENYDLVDEVVAQGDNAESQFLGLVNSLLG